MKATDYTIAISNFQRPEHLRRCLESVKSLPNVVVACYGAGPDHRKIIEEVRPGTRCYVTENDHGENRLLMQAVVLAETEWVVILHDDDQLVPEFQKVIGDVEVGEAGFIGWDGRTEWYGKKTENDVFPWGKIPDGKFPTAMLVDHVTKENGGMVRSPVTMMLRRDLALAVLSWCEEGLKEFHTRPKMMIGNEIALLFGHIKQYPLWYHIKAPLVKFGHWEGSETCQWLNGKCPELVKLYDAVRRKLGGEQFLFRRDRIVPIFVHVHTTGGHNPRKELARKTWENEWKSIEKDWLVVPLCLKSEDMVRTSVSVRDERRMPFVKDLIRKAAGYTCGRQDVVMLTNDDVCITESGLRKMLERTLAKGSTYAHRRTFHEQKIKKLGLTRLSRVLTPLEVTTGRRHSGTDAVLVTKEWWNDIGEPGFGDFIIGCEAWDTLFIMVSRLSGSGWGWGNTTYHEYHGGWWEDSTQRFTNQGQLHNRKVAKEMLMAYGIYKGEFEEGVRKDPAFPNNPPCQDTEPDAPLMPYIGGKNIEIKHVWEEQEKHYSWKPEPFIVPKHPTIEKAIVYPWKASNAKWDELRYSIRSLEKNFTDKTSPIFIYGTESPAFLKNSGRIKFFDEWTYAEAVLRGTQSAKKILWMNDDILMLEPCGWEDFETAVHAGKCDTEVAMKWQTDEIRNRWRKGLGRAVLALAECGIDPVMNFSTHTPYVYERDKALEIFKRFGLWEKIPLETLYFNYHKTPCRPIGGFKCKGLPVTPDAVVMNYVDRLITREFKEFVMNRFPDPTPYEFVNRVKEFA